LQCIPIGYILPTETRFTASYALVSMINKYLAKWNPAVQLVSMAAEANGASDEQTIVIQHGAKIKSDTQVWELDKELRFLTGFWFAKGRGYHGVTFSIVGRPKLTNYYSTEGAEWHPPRMVV